MIDLQRDIKFRVLETLTTHKDNDIISIFESFFEGRITVEHVEKQIKQAMNRYERLTKELKEMGIENG